jgi:hypothetical protein
LLELGGELLSKWSLNDRRRCREIHGQALHCILSATEAFSSSTDGP